MNEKKLGKGRAAATTEITSALAQPWRRSLGLPAPEAHVPAYLPSTWTCHLKSDIPRETTEQSS